MYIHICRYICIYVCIDVCMYVCMYTYAKNDTSPMPCMFELLVGLDAVTRSVSNTSVSGAIGVGSCLGLELRVQ